jgi:hypothetical protein
VERRPRLLLSAPFFPLMRVLDAAIGLSAIPLAWLASSNGVWKSPARRRAPGLHARIGPRPVPATIIPEIRSAAYLIEPAAAPAATQQAAAYEQAAYEQAAYEQAAYEQAAHEQAAYEQAAYEPEAESHHASG